MPTSLVMVASIPLALAAGPVDEALVRRVDELETRLARVEARRNASPLTAARAEEIRHLVAEVLADADTRAGLLSDGVTAGHDGDFFVASADGSFRLEVGGQIQSRYVWNRRQDDPGNETRAGFEVRRAKIDVSGHVLSPDLQYSVTGAYDQNTGRLALQTMYIEYNPSEELRLRIGRMRPPLLREEAVSSRRQLLVERSLVRRAFRQLRNTGLALRYETPRWRVLAGFHDLPDPAGNGWLASCRAELLAWGRWSRLRDFTSFPDQQPTGAIGGGILYADGSFPDPTKTLRWTVDASVEFGGANAFAAVIGNHADTGGETLDQFGAVVHGGFFVGDRWELFARYEWGDADGLAADLSVLTAGFNRYVDGHELKWTVDIGYSFNEVGGFWSTSRAHWLTDAAGRTGQIVGRAQLQLLF